MRAQYEELHRKKTDLFEQWEEHMHILKTMERAYRTEALATDEEPWRYFKPSKEKGEPTLGVIPTNLQVHTCTVAPHKVTLEKHVKGSPKSLTIEPSFFRNSSERFWDEDAGDTPWGTQTGSELEVCVVPEDLEESDVNTVTIGAATAGCLKSKSGGLVSMRNKMEKLLEQNRVRMLDGLTPHGCWLGAHVLCLSCIPTRTMIGTTCG